MKRVGLLLVLLGACGGGDGGEGEPLVSSTLVASVNGKDFTPDSGIVFAYASGAPVIVLGRGDIHCDTFANDDRPEGRYAYIVPDPQATELAVQTYTDVGISIESYTSSSIDIVGSDGGTVNITAISATTVTGDVDYHYAPDGEEIGLISGAFEVTRCP